MRRYRDPSGGDWDVVIGRESWGVLYALFVPAGTGRTEPVRQALLRAASHEAAELELDRLDDAALEALFRESKPKES